ncbi:ABZJ_00895 family protein [Alkalimarinus sediminis]|uniref:ABZJ_00895 family protein n=1 Tax=Alkalimarinus sediminis TaxID=1632866 RepID=A0A9E8HJJ1_9ALTE|nr:ABZJ_00895 family protein [Alkalimarinus sediminis]UZW74517.1 ABZJ_00895 family protein [Alkalimarinus sediminis]
MSQDEVKIYKYVLIFSGFYAVFLAAINILAHGFNIDLGSSGNIATLLGAGYGAAVKFVNDVQRAPFKKEKRILSMLCLTSSFFISLLAVLVVVPLVGGEKLTNEILEALKALSPFIWLGVAAFIGIIYYLILSFIFGWASKKYASKAVSA